jgi:hypothetical protein
MTQIIQKLGWWSAVLGLVLASVVLPIRVAAQDQYQQQDDPPSRVARIGYMEGSVSFQPAGETEWVQAVPNRPMTTGDKIWADRDSRAELQLGSAVIRLGANSGFSFLNLDDRTAQIQLTSGTLNVRVRRLDRNDVFEIDTPNLAFSVYEPGNYRVEASEDGTYTVVSPREGRGEATGNGQTYTIHAGQRVTFSGTESLNADVLQISGADQFDNWAYNRDHRYDNSRSARYLSHDVVGYEDLDDNGDWRDDSHYGHVWYPNHVEAGWAPYHHGHWEWIAPWGYTWVDDSSWGYAPFHYGRWVTVEGRWGWVAGPVEVQAVYAPALVVFIGGGGGRGGVGIGLGFGGNVGWFPLGPQEVYVPSYHVSREYVERVNISNTTVNTTTVTNIYNTTVINNNTNNTTITNVNYANRNVQGAVTVVPQRAFATAQPVAKVAVAVNPQQIAAAPVSARVTVAPTREAVLGVKAATANRVTAPPPAVINRPVIAKTPPPPPPVPFVKQQQALAAHPGQPLAKQEVQTLRPAAAEAAHPMVKVAPPGKPATPTMGRPANQPGNQQNTERPGQPASNQPANQPGNRPGNQPGNQPANQPNAGRPGQPASNQPANQPGNRPGNQPAPNERPGAAVPAQPNRPPSAQPNQPAQPNNRPDMNRPPAAQPNNRPPAQPNQPAPAQPNNRPEANRPPAPQPNNRPTPQPNQPAPAQPNNRPEANRPPAPQLNNRPEMNRPPAPQPNQPPPNNRPEANRPPATPPNNRPNPQNNQPEPPRPQTNRPEPPARNTPPPAAQPNNRPEPSRPEPNRNQPAPAPRPQPPAPPERQQPQPPQQRTPPPAARPAPPPQRPLTPEEKRKQEEERKKREQQNPPGV